MVPNAYLIAIQELITMENNVYNVLQHAETVLEQLQLALLVLLGNISITVNVTQLAPLLW